jgi:hypothetical protein
MKKSFLAGAILAGVMTSAASAATVSDNYWGGIRPSGTGDVIGGSNFEVTNMVVERIGDDLNVVINTNYANVAGSAAALGTRMGSLFIGDPGNLDLAGAGPYAGDTFAADTNRFSYAFDFTTKTGLDGFAANSTITANSSGTGTLYSLAPDGSNVRQSFGNPSQFRTGQAVDVLTGGANAATSTGVNGTWSVGAGNVTFNIADFFTLNGLPAIYQTSLTLAWTMSCANDVILNVVTLDKDSIPDAPIPAGAALLISGLMGLGALGRKKKA